LYTGINPVPNPSILPNTDPADTNPFPEEVLHCGFNKVGGTNFTPSTVFGPYKICKSKITDDIYLQFQNAVADANVCVFPTTSSTGGSVYIGEARCVVATSPYSIYKLNMIKNRPNYSQYQMTGIMMMKDMKYYYPNRFRAYEYAPNAYMFCMQWLDQTCNSASCDSSYCEDFKSIRQHIYTTL